MARAPQLIIGQGLAGTALAWRCWERGVPFVIVDRDEAVTCSKTAAGLLTPVTGMRLTLTEAYAPRLCEAVKFYRQRERLLGVNFLHARRHVRWFKNDKEPARWAERMREPHVLPFISKSPPEVNADIFSTPRGGFEMKHAGWLDTVTYLAASRRFFEQLGCVATTDFDHAELSIGSDVVGWRGQRFENVIFATGWEAMRHPWFDWVPFLPVRGTILTARADLDGERRIMSLGCWIVPRADGTLRIGSTYETKFASANGFDEAKLAELHATLRRFVKVPVEILDQQAAVRPSIEGQLTLIGRHPGRSRVAFLNGMGSKGTLLSPMLSRLLTEHLFDGVPVPLEFDLCRNF